MLILLIFLLLNIFYYFFFKKSIKNNKSSLFSFYFKISRFTSLIIILCLLFSSIQTTKTIKCHTCLTQCKLIENGNLDPIKCDCGGNDNETCIAENCFVKIELFREEMVGIVQKGCVNGLPIRTDGCSYSGQTESIHCYCQGELCNERIKLNNYLPSKLPTIECCECGGGEQQDQCPNTDILSVEKTSSSGVCSRVCRGNYCLVDFGGNEQGCGQGVPRLQNFLRISDYLNQLQGQLVCAYYQASTETIVNGCVCTEPSGNCNQRNRTWNHQMEKVLGRRTDDLNYCYSLHARSDDEPINENIYKKSETCEGHFCFVSLSTREMAIEPEISNDGSSTSLNSFVGVSKQRFELLGGC
uniref:Activin_recp domain-containing protein n=1 Tax=Meloidogyne hapla TaxID=6305 RepID=A0A1I8BC12_MELHA